MESDFEFIAGQNDQPVLEIANQDSRVSMLLKELRKNTPAHLNPRRYLLGLLTQKDLGLRGDENLGEVKTALAQKGVQPVSLDNLYLYIQEIDKIFSSKNDCLRPLTTIWAIIEPDLGNELQVLTKTNAAGALVDVSLMVVAASQVICHSDKEPLFLVLKEVKSAKDSLTVSLVEDYYRNIHYGCHSVEIEINRSLAGQELVNRGKEALRPLAEKMTDELLSAKPVDYGFFLACICLLFEIIEKHNLPGAPYPSGTKVSAQRAIDWINYCHNNG